MTRRALLLGAVPAASRAPAIAITIDDFHWAAIPAPFGPVANRALLDTFEAHGLKTALFVIGRNIESAHGRALLEPWNEAGHLIGNHTYSHRSFHSLPVAEFESDTLRCHELLRTYPATERASSVSRNSKKAIPPKSAMTFGASWARTACATGTSQWMPRIGFTITNCARD